jgi:aminobenzoyl-glutamate transport protein
MLESDTPVKKSSQKNQKSEKGSTEKATEKKSAFMRSLDLVERVGNALPDPVTLFVLFALIVIFASWVLSGLGVEATHPADGRVIVPDNLLTVENIRRMFTGAVGNFTAFPPLGLVLVTMIGIGVAERSGLITTSLKQLVSVVPKSALTMTLVFGGVMSSMAADAGYVVLTPLGAVLFAGLGRHPIAGLAAAFAGVSGGFSANLFLTSLDPLLSGLSTTSAQILDPTYVVQASANYYFMVVSVFFVTFAGTWVTNRFVEPRLGPWTPGKELTSEDTDLGKVADQEKKGLRAAGIVGGLFLVLTLFLVLPENGVFRDTDGGLGPFYSSLVPLLMLFFLSLGLAYGFVAKTIRSDKDVVKMMGDTMGTMGSYIILAFVAAQFVAYFAWSNIGIIMAISGAGLLTAIGFAGFPLLIAFIFVSGSINMLVGSASAKWAIMGPVFVPMLMMMGYSPEVIQAAYRVGDSATNMISPLLPYFPIIIAFAKKYDSKVGIGTLISAMVPYSIVFGIGWIILLAVWILLGIPLGPDAPLHYGN